MKYQMNWKSARMTVDTVAGTISGNTYPAKEWIKGTFDVKWDSASKCWIGSPEAIANEILVHMDYYKRVNNLSEITATAPAPQSCSHSDTLCPICHTYCYGDCKAH